VVALAKLGVYLHHSTVFNGGSFSAFLFFFASFHFFLCAGTKKKRNEGEKHQTVEWKEICSEKE
jgi:hypothetical protein